MRLDSVLTFLGWGIFYFLAYLPLPLARALGQLVGRFNYRFDTGVAKISRTNLELCLPEQNQQEREAMCRASLIATAQAGFEMPGVWLRDLETSRHWIQEVVNEQLLEEAEKAGNGVIVLLPHIGNWEAFNIYYALRGKMTALYHPPRQAFLRPIFRKIREKLGNELVATDKRGIMRLFRSLSAGGTTVVLPDQIPASGEFAPLFNHQALTDPLIVRLAQKTGAKIIGTCVTRVAKGYKVEFYQVPDDIYHPEQDRSLAALNQAIEMAVRIAPKQYQWEYKRFRIRPKGEKILYHYKYDEDYYHGQFDE